MSNKSSLPSSRQNVSPPLMTRNRRQVDLIDRRGEGTEKSNDPHDITGKDIGLDERHCRESKLSILGNIQKPVIKERNPSNLKFIHIVVLWELFWSRRKVDR